MGDEKRDRSSNDEIRLTKAELVEMLSAAAGAAAKAAIEAAKGPPVGTQDEQFRAFSEAMHPKVQPSAAPEIREHCTSPATGATFVARVVRSRAFPQGRIVDLEDYTYPSGVELAQAAGGLVPDGIPIKTPQGELMPIYKHWRWTTFYQADLGAWVGKPLPSYILTPPPAANVRAAE
jgi:hypothetical protein